MLNVKPESRRPRLSAVVRATAVLALLCALAACKKDAAEDPAAATADYFAVDGQNLGFVQAIQSGRSVGVPGTIALYKAAHARFGRLPWAQNFQAAIRLAEEGFIVSPRLANALGPRFQNGPLGRNPASAEYFFPGGHALAVAVDDEDPGFAHDASPRRLPPACRESRICITSWT